MSASGERENTQPEQPAVDESLIDAMLALTPEERLRHNDRMLRTIELLRRGLDEKTADHG